MTSAALLAVMGLAVLAPELGEAAARSEGGAVAPRSAAAAPGAGAASARERGPKTEAAPAAPGLPAATGERAAAPVPAAPAPSPVVPEAAAADPDAPTVAGRLDKAEGHVGDVFTLTVTAVSRKSTPVNLPAAPDLTPFAILDRKETEQDIGDGRVRREFTIQIAAYEPGDVTLPAVEVTYLGKGGEVLTAKTAPVMVKVKSLLANEPEPALKDNAGPVGVTEENRWPIYLGAGLAAALFGGLLTLALVRRFRARASKRPVAPPRPAHRVALEKLDRLGAEGFAEDGDHRPFTFAVSEVVREYLGARFGFDSLELTTDELVAALRRHAGRQILLAEIEGWLATCDLVKFAKISPTAAEARGLLETAIRIVEATRPRDEAPLAGGQARGTTGGTTGGGTTGGTTGGGTTEGGTTGGTTGDAPGDQARDEPAGAAEGGDGVPRTGAEVPRA